MAEAKWISLHPRDLEDEDKMRAALGLSPSGAQQIIQAPSTMRRRSFVKEGEVEVERKPITDGGTNRLEQAQAALRAEHDARIKVEMELTAAKAAIDKMQTEVAHLEMALREAQEGRLAAEQALEERRSGEAAEPPQTAPEPAVEPVQRKRMGRPRKGEVRPEPPVVEQEPVAWWEPGWKKAFGIR